MLNDRNDRDTGAAADIGALMERFAREGRDWAEAEAKLARLELIAFKSQILRLVLLATAAAAAGLCMLLALTQALIAVLADVLPGIAAAAGAVMVIFAGIAGICLFAARRAVSWRTESIFLRWLDAGR